MFGCYLRADDVNGLFQNDSHVFVSGVGHHPGCGSAVSQCNSGDVCSGVSTKCRCNNSNNFSVLCGQAIGDRREAKPIETKLYGRGDISGILPGKMTNEDVDNSNNPPPLSRSSVVISDSLSVKVVGENSTESSMQPNQLKCDNTSIPGGLPNTECNDQSYSSKEPRVMQLALIPENGYGNLIRVQIGSASALALVDSGAQVSCLSHTFLKKYNNPFTEAYVYQANISGWGRKQ